MTVKATQTLKEEVPSRMEPLERLLTIKQIADETGISRSTIYRRMEEGTFPKPVRIGPRATRWRASTIKDWLEGLKDSDEV